MKKKTFEELKTSVKQASKILKILKKKSKKKKVKDLDANIAVISNGWTESSG